VTILFPKEAKTFAASLRPGPQDLLASQAEQFVVMASRRYNCERTFFYADTERVRLPRSAKRVEHIRGLGTEIWASTHQRIGIEE
jgi:hypothetical protein